jgi:RalA-binding protein 1
MSTSLTSHVGAVDLDQLRTQNEQLWKIIERQRTKIQALQKENSLLITERDGLQEKVNALDSNHEQQQQQQACPMPPTRSPYRSNNNNNHQLVLPSCTLNTNNSSMDMDSQQQLQQSHVLLDKGDTPTALSPSPSSTSSSSSSCVIPMANSMSSLRPHSPTVVITEGGVAQDGGSYRLKRKSQLFSSPTPALPSGVDLDAPGLDPGDLTQLSPKKLPTAATSTSSPLPPLPPIYNLPSISSSSISSFSTSTSSTTMLSPDTSSTSLAPSAFENGINNNNITIKVLGSNIRQNDKSREVISFIISIGRKQQHDEGQELWRVEKLYSHFLELDTKVITNPSLILFVFINTNHHLS